MPFTPFHFGPGAAIKAVLGRRFSFAVFCFAQVATDCETGYYLLKGEYPWHRFCHTFLGATLVGAFSVLVGRPICRFAVYLLRDWFELGVTPRAPVAIPLVAALSGHISAPTATSSLTASCTKTSFRSCRGARPIPFMG